MVFETVEEKYQHFAATGVRLGRGECWATNPEMTSDSGIPVLIRVSEADLKREGHPLKKQGYVRFSPPVKVDPPVEAKSVKANTPNPSKS